MTAPTRAVIVGAGLMGRWHADAVARTGGRIAAVVDPSPGPATALARQHGCASYSDLPSALAAAKADFVHVCTPLATHVALASTALEAGCHVVVEKPVAPTVEETERVLDTARARGRMVVPVFQFLFQDGLLELLGSLDRFGRLVHVRGTALSAGADGGDARERDRVALEILPHFLALLARILRVPVSEIDLRLERTGAGELELTGVSGGTGIAVLLSMSARPTRNSLEVMGTEASALADLFHGFVTWEGGGSSRRQKILRPFLVSGAQLGRAASNLAVRAVRRELAYPGLRELIGRAHAAARAGAPPPILPSEVADVAHAWDRLKAEVARLA